MVKKERADKKAELKKTYLNYKHQEMLQKARTAREVLPDIVQTVQHGLEFLDTEMKAGGKRIEHTVMKMSDIQKLKEMRENIPNLCGNFELNISKLAPSIIGDMWEKLETDMRTLEGLMDDVKTMMVSMYANEFCSSNQMKFYDHARFRKLIDDRIMVLQALGAQMDTEL